jgi:phage baseplate assembly protein W
MAINNRLKDPISAFSDINMNFEIDPLTEDIELVTGVESVRQSLKNLLQLKRYEKPFHPEIESGIMDLLFEPANPLIALQLKRKITELVQAYEKRVRGLKVNIIDLMNENAYKIDIEFQVENRVETYKATVIVERIR